MIQRSRVFVVFSITVTPPVPCEVVGGISFAPDNGAPKASVAACDAGDNIRTTLLKLIAKTKTRDFMATVLHSRGVLNQPAGFRFLRQPSRHNPTRPESN